jgi:hypothetical protein
MLLFFGVTASVQALPFAIASIVNGPNGTGGPHPDTTAGMLYFGDGVNEYNATDLNPWFGTSITGGFTNYVGFSGSLSGKFDFTGLSESYHYLSVKFDGYVALYDISGSDYFDWVNPTKYAYSHGRLWGGTSVPDASIMLLLGSSFLGFSVFSRKRKKS